MPRVQKFSIRKLFKSPTRGASSNSSSSTGSSGFMPSTSEITPGVSSTTQQPLEMREVIDKVKRWKIVSSGLQNAAGFRTKFKWTTSQREKFMDYLESIHYSNDIIRDIAIIRALISIHGVVVGTQKAIEIPENVLAVNRWLPRLHRANTYINKKRLISLQFPSTFQTQAKDYVSNSRRITLDHTYIELREDSAVYPLHIHVAGAEKTKMVLAETLLYAPKLDPAASNLNTERTLAQMFCDEEGEDDESLRKLAKS